MKASQDCQDLEKHWQTIRADNKALVGAPVMASVAA